MLVDPPNGSYYQPPLPFTFSSFQAGPVVLVKELTFLSILAQPAWNRNTASQLLAVCTLETVRCFISLFKLPHILIEIVPCVLLVQEDKIIALLQTYFLFALFQMKSIIVSSTNGFSYQQFPLLPLSLFENVTVPP